MEVSEREKRKGDKKRNIRGEKVFKNMIERIAENEEKKIITSWNSKRRKNRGKKIKRKAIRENEGEADKLKESWEGKGIRAFPRQ